MAIGAQFIIRFHQNASGAVVFDSIQRKEITHDASFTSPTSAIKTEDFPATHKDAYAVQFSYPSGQEPDLTATTVHDLIGNAVTVVNAAITAKTIGGGVGSTITFS